ncbi:MAG: type II toxin-antitoxin system RelE/ParE family toxin [Bacteriovoracales bacterium]|nr:type II toxin-antitoxin system RelE/ParE family toxin [Bacteriovoracales bacterium]
MTDNGISPFKTWFEKLEQTTRAISARSIQKVARGGGKKSVKSLKDGVFEIKISYGPGYRVYFAEEDNEIILLLIGGDKKSQNRDIKKAKDFWNNYVK